MASEKRLRLAFISKYFPPLKRISGTGNFSFYLCRELNKQADLAVVSGKSKGLENESLEENVCVKRTGFPFPLRAGLIARKHGKDAVVFSSGFISMNLLAIYLIFLKIALVGRKVVLFQLVEPDVEKSAFLFRFISPLVQKIVCTNKVIEAYFEKLAPGKTALIYPGIDVMHLKSVPKKGSGKVRVGYFGHFLRHKGIDQLVATFDVLKLKNAELLVVGNDWRDDKLEKETLQKAKSNQSITFLGYQDNIFGLMQSCDIIVFPFRSSKKVLGVSLTAIEAMALEKPVIGSNVSVLNSLIEDKENGLIFSSESELRVALKVLCNDSALRKRLGVNARKTVEKNFNIVLTAEKFSKLCKQIVEAP